MLVGNGHQRLVITLARVKFDDPALQAVGPRRFHPEGGLQRTARALDQEGAQIDIAAQTDSPQARLATRAVLPGGDPQPGTKLPPVFENLRVRNQSCHRTGGDDTDTVEFTRASGGFRAFGMRRDFRLTAIEPLVQRRKLFAGLKQERMHGAGQPGIFAQAWQSTDEPIR